MERSAYLPMLDLTETTTTRPRTIADPPRPSVFAGLLTIADLERDFGVGNQTRQRYVAAGLPEIRLGRKRFYEAAKVRAWILSHEHRQEPKLGRGVAKRVP